MKTLVLLRHAKSSWSDQGVPDHDRPLTPRGERAAAGMAVYLAQQDLRPGLVLCSTARRAVETLEALLPQLPDATVRRERGLHLASTGKLLSYVQDADDAADSLLVIGHNPGIEELAQTLAGSGDHEAGERLRRKFPTAALAELRFDLDHWTEVAPGRGHLCRFVTPKELL